MERGQGYRKIAAASVLLTAGAGLCAMIGAVRYAGAHVGAYQALRARWGGAEFLDSEGVVRQRGTHDCGSACLRMVFRDAGLDDAPRAPVVSASEDASLYQLALAAKRAGLEAQAWVLTAADLARARKPLIAFIDGNHFVVVDAADDAQTVVRDPSLGRLRFSKKAFLARWRGEALIFGDAESMFSVSSVPGPSGGALRGINKGIGGPLFRQRPPSALSPQKRSSSP